MEVIVVNGTRWLHEKHVKEGLDHANLLIFTRRCTLEYRKHKHELVDDPENKQTESFYMSNKNNNGL